MRYLAIDLGDKRTGLALGDDVTRLTSPLDLLEVPLARNGGEDLIAALVRAIDEALGRDKGELVMGLPLHANGEESPRAKLTREFAKRLESRTGRVVRLFDERRTSIAADSRLARSGLTHKQKKLRRDAIAAAAILESFLAASDAMEPIEDEPEQSE
ncbi:MAG: Holliday junction resolvase RuvX [Phycisphaerae bacterium]|nr:Holliday junction resolvase RuvX [Phycisphaerae bacterium]